MTAKKTLALRIALDCVLIAICATIFSKNVISLMYHEVVGLALLVLFIVHVVFNRKWLGMVFSRKGHSPRVKATVVINVLLALSWLGVLVTGILVSKKLFGFQISSLNPLHFFFAAIALVMTGVHFGLHWNYFWGWLGKRVHIPRAVTAVLLAAILIFGGYRLVTSSFGRWIVAPFTPHEEHGQRTEQQVQASDAEGQPSGEGAERSGRTEGEGQSSGQRSSHGQQPFSVANLLYTIATWFSVLMLFAAATHGITMLAARRRAAV